MNTDFIKRNVEHDLGEGLCSPMEPPEARSIDSVEQISYETMDLPLRELMDEHLSYQKVLNVFEKALLELKEKGWQFTPEISAGLKAFFQFFDENVMAHDHKEEKVLFPLLREKFLQSGEHSPSEKPVTPVEVMEAEHLKVGQSVSLVFSLLGLSARMQDPADRQILLEHACHLGQEIVDTMQLHIHKENTILFPLAQQLVGVEEWVEITRKMKAV